jgi:hypothetical protein
MPLRVPTREEYDALRREIREKEARALAAVEEQVRFVVEALNTWRPGRKLSKYEWALLLHLGRATYTVMHGIVPVCEVYGGDLAMMLVRSLYETMISAYWMSIDRETRADTFDRFAGLETRELHLPLVDLGVIEAAELPAMNCVLEAGLRAEFPKPALGWTKQRLYALEKDVAVAWPEDSRHEFKRYSKAARNIGNRHAQASPGETIARIAVNDGGAEITIGPTLRARQSVPIALKIGGWCYGQLVDLVVEHVGVGNLERSRAHSRRAMLRTRELTEDEVRGLGSEAADCPCGSGFSYTQCHGEPITQVGAGWRVDC